MAAGGGGGVWPLGEEVAELGCPGEEGLVKTLQVGGPIEAVGAGGEGSGGPGGGTAIAAVHHRQVGAGVATGEVVGMAQLGLGFHRGHHALELPQPELHAQGEPGHHHLCSIELGGGAAGMGEQGQQAFEQQHAVATWIAFSQAQLAGETLQQLIHRAGVRRLAHQVVHRREGAELPAEGQAPGIGVDIALGRRRQGLAQPEGGLGGEVGVGTGGVFGIQLLLRFHARQRQGKQAAVFGVAVAGVISEKLLRAEPLLFNQRGGLEMAGEDLAGVVEHRLA